jgi:hypothetical protein
MPVSLVIEQVPNRRGGASAVGAYGFSKSWRVLAPSALYHQGQVLSSFVSQTGVGLGTKWAIGASEFDPLYEEYEIYCVDLAIDEGANTAEGQEWVITGRWEPADPALLGPGAIPEDPTEAPVSVEYLSYDEAFALNADKDGNLIVNSAGDWFAEPVEAEATYDLIRITRYERMFNPSNAYYWRHRVNSEPWMFRGVEYPRRTARMMRIEPGKELWHQVVGRYFAVVYDVGIRPLVWDGGAGDQGQGWDLRVANIGYRQKIGGTVRVILEDNGQPVSDPRPLDPSTGAALAYPLSAATAMPRRTFRVRLERDFNELGFPVA